MRKSIFILTAFISSHCLSQSRLSLSTQEPDYYVDSVRVNSLGVFDPNKIESIKVVKDSTGLSGKLYIKIKKSATLNLLTSKDIVRINNITPGSFPIFVLDDQIIKDTSNFRIDSSYILKIEIVNASEIKYLPENISNIKILNITTATQANIDKEKSIKIRSSYIPG